MNKCTKGNLWVKSKPLTKELDGWEQPVPCSKTVEDPGSTTPWLILAGGLPTTRNLSLVEEATCLN